MVDYPEILPLDAAQKCIEIVKNRQINERKVEFAHAAWNVQGYAQKMLLGDKTVASSPDQLALDASFQELADELGKADEEGMQFGAENEEEAGSVVVVLTIIGLIVQTLSALGFLKRDEEVEG